MKFRKIFALMLVCCLFVMGIPIKGDFSISANAEEITVESFLNSAYNSAKIQLYDGTDTTKAFYMNGRTYYQGIVFEGYKKGESFLNFNVEDIQNISFTIGHIDTSTNRAGAVLDIYKDNTYYDTINLSEYMMLQEYSLDVSDASIIRFAVDIPNYNVNISSSLRGTYGMGDFKVNSFNGQLHETPIYTDIDNFISSAFNCKNAEFRYSSDKRQSFQANGRTYYHGIILNGYEDEINTSISFNTENVSSLSFTTAHLDNSNYCANANLNIYIDNKYFDTIKLSQYMVLQNYNLDVADASIVRFSVEIPNYNVNISSSLRGTYVLTDFKMDSKKSVSYDVPIYEDSVEFITSAYDLRNAEIHTSIEKNESFNVNGKTYKQGIILNGWMDESNTSVSFNVENVDSITFKAGHLDNSNRIANAELNVYLNNVYYDTIELSQYMVTTEYTLDVAESSILRFSVKIPNYNINISSSLGGTYALADFSISASKSEPQTQELKAGDADGSGEVDILDIITINKAIMGKENLSENGLKAIDFNGNGKPDSDEALKVLKFIVGMITDLTA